MTDKMKTNSSSDELGEWIAKISYESSPEKNRFIPTWSLQSVGARPPLKEYIKQLWRYRYFILYQSKAKAFASARNTFLGRVWLVLQPFLEAAVYYTVFGLLLQTSRGVENFVAYLVVGVSFFGIMLNSLVMGGRIINESRNVIKAFAFPRATLIFSNIFRRLIDSLPLTIATLIFIVIMPPHVIPSWTWLLFIPVHILTMLFSLGIMFVVAKITVYVKDMRHIWPLLGRFWFYGSGVFFSVEMFDSHQTITTIMKINPGYQFLMAYRNVLVYGQVPSVGAWVYIGCWAIILFVFGFIFFWQSEEKYGQADL